MPGRGSRFDWIRNNTLRDRSASYSTLKRLPHILPSPLASLLSIQNLGPSLTRISLDTSSPGILLAFNCSGLSCAPGNLLLSSDAQPRQPQAQNVMLPSCLPLPPHTSSLIKETVAADLLEFKKMCDPR
ncbi:hypothetical protein CB1_001512003 [Camelus ferus]|nr:hypothetical protein CB1_001512003 [Camelus ferus]